MNKDLKIPQIKTVIGRCPECKQTALLFSIVSDFYKCSQCESEIQQYSNGSIRYIQMTDDAKEILKQMRQDNG